LHRVIPDITLAILILTFRHKGLERFFRSGDARGIRAAHLARIERMLDMLDAATRPEDLRLPGFFLHPLRGERQGEWAMRVSGNWRMTFAFEGIHCMAVNLEDYH